MSGTAGDVPARLPPLSTHFAPSVVGVVLHLNTELRKARSYTQLRPLAHDLSLSSLQSAPLAPSFTHVIELHLQ